MNLKSKLYILSGISLSICVVLGAAGYWGIDQLHPAKSALLPRLSAIKNTAMADMRHEALRSYALQALLAAKTHDPRFGQAATIAEKVNDASRGMRDNLKASEALQINSEVARDLSEAHQAVENYLNAAAIMASKADSDYSSAIEQFNRFSTSFDTLEGKFEKLSDAVERSAEEERSRSMSVASAVQDTLIITLIIAFGILTVSSVLLVRSVLGPIDRVIDGLSLSAKEVEASAAKMTASSEQLAASTTEQAAAVQESVASMTEMSGMIAQTSDSATSSLANTKRMAERTEEGNRIMERLVASIESIQQANSQLVEMVNIIGEISNKTTVINDIVFKTQLLSFNASIEAARAGQHGRGFAVVAEEVGNLAEMSGTAAKGIEALLETSRRQVSEIVEGTQQRVKDGQQVSREALAIFNEIARETSNISRQVESINDATREQQLGVQQTSTAMTQMDHAAQRNNQLAGETLESAGDLSSQSKTLTEIMRELMAVVYAQKAKGPAKKEVDSDEDNFLDEETHHADEAPASDPTEIVESHEVDGRNATELEQIAQRILAQKASNSGASFAHEDGAFRAYSPSDDPAGRKH